MEKGIRMHDTTAPPRRLRDVMDVDGYVRGAVQQAAPSGANARVLHEQGVRAVLRLERALPPGARLLPVLEAALPARLAALDRRLAPGDELIATAA